jgi:hypothetical protein
VKITREPYSPELYAEILPLARKCWEESTKSKGETCAYGDREFDIQPNIEAYERMADSIVIVTLRVEGRLVGYIEGFTYSALHHKVTAGIADSIYVEPDYRTYSVVAIEMFEKQMSSRGVKILGWPTHIEGAVYPLLIACGYKADDIVMEKRLCA